MGATSSRDVVHKSASERSLRDLLDDEDFLENILPLLAGDGLHVCRRVCRRWNAMVLRLPHRLDQVDPAALADVAGKYPNAVALRTRLEEVDGRISTVLRSLAKFKQLERLVLDVEIDKAVNVRWRPFFRSMENLAALDISWSYGDWSTAFYDGLRCMTNLTALTLITCSRSHPKARPLTELAQIQSLELTSKLLVNDSDAPLFPQLKFLTHLRFHSGLFEEGNRAYTIKALARYKRSLKSLECDLGHFVWDVDRRHDARNRLARAGVAPLPVMQVPLKGLTDFHQLRRLAILDTRCLSGQFGCQLQLLVDMTELDFGSKLRGERNEISISVLEAICTIVGLQSLTLCRMKRRLVDERSPFTSLLHLTKLVVRDDLGTSLCCLTSLQHLQIEERWTKEQDLLTTLQSMQCLQVLILRKQNHLMIPTSVLARFRGLQTLVLDCVLVDHHLFECLATFEELHHLTLTSYPRTPYPDYFMAQINDLHHLQSLTLDCWAQHSMSHYLWTGSFPRLTELELRKFTEDEGRELFQRLPLHSLKVRDPSWGTVPS